MRFAKYCFICAEIVMKILSADLWPTWGGGQLMAYRYAMLLEEYSGIDIHFVVSSGGKLAEKLKDTFSLYNAPMPESDVDNNTVMALQDVLLKLQPDIVLSHGVTTGRQVAHAINGKKMNIMHQIVMHTMKTCGISGLANSFIAVSAALRDQAMQDGIAPNKIIHIPNFLTENIPDLVPERKIGEPLTLGFLGRVSPEKAPERFVEVIACLKKANIDIQGIFGGLGDAMASTQDNAKKLGVYNCIEWAGWITEEKKAHFFETIDILILPSETESFSMVILEAMAHGTPVISTKTDGPCEILTHKENGFLTNFTAQSIADAVQELSNNSKLYNKIRQQAHRTVHKYHINSVRKQLCKAVIGQNPSL